MLLDSVDHQRQRQCGETEDECAHDGETVEIALDHRGSRCGDAEAAAEHVGQPSPAPAVEQHEDDRDDAGDDLQAKRENEHREVSLAAVGES